MKPSVKKNLSEKEESFYMDNDPKHTSKSMIDHLEVTFGHDPHRCPDLHIIGNLWTDLRGAVIAHKSDTKNT